MSYPNYPNYPNSSGYPGGYPPAQGYPPQQAPYPGYPGYSAQQQSIAPGYPQQPGYCPPAPTSYPVPQPYPGAQPGYPVPQQQQSYPSPYGQPGGFSQQQVHHHHQQQQPPMEQSIPTVHPASPFDARADADRLHKAMKGLGTDEKGLMEVLCRRTAAQRVQIGQAYKSGYGKDLIAHIKSETSGNFERLLVALCQSSADFLASELHEAVKGLGTEEGTLVEILCSRDNQEIRDIAASYQKLFGHSMEKDIKGDTSGTLKMLLISLAQGNRDENPVVDISKAREDAQRLYQAGAGKFGTDESTFNSILVTRSWPYLRQLIHDYHATTGQSLEAAVKAEFSANAEKGLLAILQCAQSRPNYLAERIHNAISGAGTKDRALIRLVVSRCDVDMGNIKRAYQLKYGRTVEADISGDCSGDYKKALLILVA